MHRYRPLSRPPGAFCAGQFWADCITSTAGPDFDSHRVGKAHVTDQLVYLRRHLRPSPAVSRFPAPIGSEPCAVPTDHGIRLDDRQRAPNIGEPPIEADEYQSVGAAEEKPLWRGPPQGIDLLAQHQDLRLKLCSRSEQVDEHPPDQSAKVPHRATTSPDSRSSASRMRFPIGTGKIRSLAVLLGVGVAAVGATAGGSMMSIISQ